MSERHYVNMSVCQYVRMQLFSLGIKMKVVQNVIRMSDSHYVIMSKRQYISMSICQNATFQLRYQNKSCSKCNLYKDVRMSRCQNATFQLGYQNESCSECHYDVR